MNQFASNLKTWIALLMVVGLSACGGGDEYNGFDGSVTLSTPDGYLKFFNRQADLGAGDYTLVVATAVAAQSGTFSVTVKRNDGSTTQIINGSWVNSGGLDSDPTCASGNLCYNFSLADASGATFTLTTALDGVLYLVDNRGATPQVAATANDGLVGVAEILAFSDSAIDESGFASAYYAAIDPGDARDTAQKFWSLHGFDTPGPDVHVIFRDSKDLGYGRDMYMRSYPNPDCPGQIIAFFVRNFSVEIVEGFAYGPVNLEAAIAEDLQHHIGSNAIEFSTGRTSSGATDTCSTEPMAKFYTYEPIYNPPSANHPRRTRVDLDARGAKAMPQPCISCHGGKLRPLDRNGDFVAMHADDPANQIGDTKARMQAFEVDTFDYSPQAPYRRVDQEENLRILNAAIYCTYPGSTGHPACAVHGGGLPAQVNNGEWSGDFGRDMLLGWYGDDGINDALNIVGSSFDVSFVPAGWTPSPGGPPVGADTLFLKVIGPNCFVCHGKRGNELGSDTSTGTNTDATDGKDIDFGSWDKFISHADEIERLVFDEGKMPLGLLNYQNFWDDPEKGELLASFIAPYVTDPAGFQARRINASGNVILPGRVVARAGPDRITRQNAAITLNAQASLFADSYSWSLLSSPVGGEDAVISSATSIRSDFSADTDGDYVVQLMARSSTEGDQDTDTVTIKVDNINLATAPRDLTFYTDITGELATCAGACHDSGLLSGIPVWWTEAQRFGTQPVVTNPQLGFYEQVMARVNLENIEDSLLLKKPSRLHHNGGAQAQGFGYDLTTGLGHFDRRNYDMFVNWIAEGAPCGGTPVQCVR